MIIIGFNSKNKEFKDEIIKHFDNEIIEDNQNIECDARRGN